MPTRLTPLDTAPDADAVQLSAYARLGGAARVSIAFELSALARAAALAGIRHRHPEYDDRTAARALQRLLLGDALAGAIRPGEALVEP